MNILHRTENILQYCFDIMIEIVLHNKFVVVKFSNPLWSPFQSTTVVQTSDFLLEKMYGYAMPQ